MAALRSQKGCCQEIGIASNLSNVSLTFVPAVGLLRRSQIAGDRLQLSPSQLEVRSTFHFWESSSRLGGA